MRLSLYVLLLLSAGNAVPADGPPSPKRIIAALLANTDIPLTVDASCKGVGSEPGDASLRDYVSGLLENFTDASAKNSIAVKATPATLPGGERGWQCVVEFVHVPGGDPFRYGVSFQLRKDGTLVRRSARCIGAG